MKITGRIEKVGNITSVVIESRVMAGRVEIHGQVYDDWDVADWDDGQVVYLNISAQPQDDDKLDQLLLQTKPVTYSDRDNPFMHAHGRPVLPGQG